MNAFPSNPGYEPGSLLAPAVRELPGEGCPEIVEPTKEELIAASFFGTVEEAFGQTADVFTECGV